MNLDKIYKTYICLLRKCCVLSDIWCVSVRLWSSPGKRCGFQGSKWGRRFDARSEVMPESVLNYCNFNTRETEVSSTAIFLWGKAGQLSF